MLWLQLALCWSCKHIAWFVTSVHVKIAVGCSFNASADYQQLAAEPTLCLAALMTFLLPDLPCLLCLLRPAVLQFLGSPFLLWKSFMSGTVSCALYAVGLSYYHYLNFLGYSALPFLERTEVGGWVAKRFAGRFRLARAAEWQA
jgi:hypothetical protein